MACRVPGCCTSYWSKKTNKRLFRALTVKQLADWRVKLYAHGIEDFSASDAICILHFAEYDIERERTIFKKGGKSFKEKMRRCELRHGAVPTIFPNEIGEIKEMPNNEDSRKETSSDFNDAKNYEAIYRKPIETDNLFQSLLDIINSGQELFPSMFVRWMSNIVDNEHIKWVRCKMNDSKEEKVILLSKSLTVKIFLEGNEIRLGEKFNNVNNINDLRNLFDAANRIMPCRKTTLQSRQVVDACLGYVFRKDTGRPAHRCFPCQRNERKFCKRLQPKFVIDRTQEWKRTRIKCNTMDSSNKHLKIKESEEEHRDWLDAIGPNLKESTREGRIKNVCDLHFEEDCFIRGDSRMLIDGQEVNIPRKILRLKSGSVPTIFNVSEDTDTDTESFGNFKRQKLSSPQTVETYNIKMLLDDLRAVSESGSLPSFWHILVPDNRGDFGGIALLFNGEIPTNFSRSVYVREDMTLDIRANGNVCQLQYFRRVSSLEELLEVLRVFGSLRVCIGADDPEPCPIGFFEADESRKSSRCESCREKRIRKRSRLLRKNRRSATIKMTDEERLSNLRRKLDRTNKRLEATRIILDRLKAHYNIRNKEFFSTALVVSPKRELDVSKIEDSESGE